MNSNLTDLSSLKTQVKEETLIIDLKSGPGSLGEITEQQYSWVAHRDGEYEDLLLPTEQGEGHIFLCHNGQGITLVQYRCTLRQEVCLRFGTPQQRPVIVSFGKKGNISYHTDRQCIRQSADSSRGVIICDQSEMIEMTIPARTEVAFDQIWVDPTSYLSVISGATGVDRARYERILEEHLASPLYHREIKCTIAITGCLKRLDGGKYRGIVRSLRITSSVMEILAYCIHQIKREGDSRRRLRLSQHDKAAIVQARTLLLQRLNEKITIEALAREVCLNRQKLKSGFKELFGTTINRFVRAERLKLARELIVNEDLSLREIATQVGYSNQSHFAARFREEYGQLPKDYRSHFVSCN